MENGKLYLIMEYCEKGDLSQYLDRIGVKKWGFWHVSENIRLGAW